MNPQFNRMITICFIVLTAVCMGAFSIVSGGFLAGYSQDIWLFSYLGLFSTIGVLLTAIAISAISMLKNERDNSGGQRLMSTCALPSNVVHLKIVSNTDSLDKLLSDENFLVDFIDLINRNFVLEVEASHDLEERGRLSNINPAIKYLKCVSEDGIIQD